MQDAPHLILCCMRNKPQSYLQCCKLLLIQGQAPFHYQICPAPPAGMTWRAGRRGHPVLPLAPALLACLLDWSRQQSVCIHSRSQLRTASTLMQRPITAAPGGQPRAPRTASRSALAAAAGNSPSICSAVPLYFSMFSRTEKPLQVEDEARGQTCICGPSGIGFALSQYWGGGAGLAGRGLLVLIRLLFLVCHVMFDCTVCVVEVFLILYRE